MSFEEKLEARLLLKHVLSICDRKTMWIIWERIEGRSWNEMAYDMGMSNCAARLHYIRILREIRESFESDPRKCVEKQRQEQLEGRREVQLTTLLEKILGRLAFRVVRVHSVFGVRFRVNYHERLEMLADVDNVFP